MAEPLTCEWLWHAATILCDGTVTCGLDDPFKVRNYGNIASATLREIMAGEAVQERRHALLCGTRCTECGLHSKVEKGNYAALSPSAPYPKTIVVESSIKCNIRCNNNICNVANDSGIHLRRESFMPWPLFKKLIDEVGPHLERLFFYNYGEPFIHPKALDMLAYARAANATMEIATSTNGILLARPGIGERIVAERLVDTIGFTIGGCDEESYRIYHKAGSFEKAIAGMKGIVDAKRALGATSPRVSWRYLLFNWNDSDEQIATALQMADEIGVDSFKFMLTTEPMHGRSLRRAPGTPGFAAIADHLEYQVFYDTNPLAEAGLWHLERSEALGPFSWTGARANVSLPVQDGAILVKLARPHSLFVEPPEVSVETPWGALPAAIGTEAWGETRIAVPAGYAATHVPVELNVSALFNPFRYQLGTDGRELGVMLAMDGALARPNPYRTLQPA